MEIFTMEKTKECIGYVLKCGSMDCMTDMRHGLDPLALRHPWRKDDWFVPISENVHIRLRKFVMDEINFVYSKHQELKPKYNIFRTWTKMQLPSLPRLNADVARMIADESFVGCIYTVGPRDTRGFVVIKVCMVDQKLFIESKNKNLWKELWCFYNTIVSLWRCFFFWCLRVCVFGIPIIHQHFIIC